MFFEDEKENLGSNSGQFIGDDSLPSIDNLDDDNDLVSFDEPKSNTSSADLPNLESLDFDDDLKFVNDDDVDDSDDELNRILNEDTSGSGSDAGFETKIQKSMEKENFGLNTQHAPTPSRAHKQEESEYGVVDEEDYGPGVSARGPEPQQKGKPNPLVLAILVAVLVVGVVYYVLQMNGAQTASQNLQPSYNNTQTENNVSEQNPEDNFSESDNFDQEEENSKEDGSIPVVNEEEVDTLKAEIPEKKSIVSVNSTGKTNPFLPVSKYEGKFDVKYDFDTVNIPKPPEEYGEDSEVASKLMSISVSGIMYDDKKPSAIISYDGDDYFVQKGDKLNEYTVVDISKNAVKISLNNNVYTANLGEEFKINVFYGNAEYKNGGARAYYGLKDDIRYNGDAGSIGAKTSKQYTSTNDIKINSL